MMPQDSMVADQEFIARWVESSSLQPEFWASCPQWVDGTAHRVVDGHLLVFTPARLLHLEPTPTLVAQWFDGETTLAELSEDLAEAGDAPLDVVRPLVATVALELLAHGAVDRVHPGPPPEVADAPVASGVGERMQVDPETGEEIRVVEGTDSRGNRMVTEYLPGNLKRVTTYLTYSIDEADELSADTEALGVALLDERRSPAELLPVDSCVGSKLRNDEAVPLVSIVCPDGLVRSVRCHDPEVEQALRAAAGDRLAPAGERGPVEAFVVTPLEGHGPLRVFDGSGRRRGRPRTVVEVVEVVDQVLGEVTARRQQGPDAPVVLIPVLAVRGSEAELLDPGTLDKLNERRRLVREGWRFSASGSLLGRDGRVRWPSVLGRDVSVASDQVGFEIDLDVPMAVVAPVLVVSLPQGADGEEMLDRLLVLVRGLMAASRLGASAS
jgi:hypothetical protein